MALESVCMITTKHVPVLVLFLPVCSLRLYLLRMRRGIRLHKASQFDIYVMCIKIYLSTEP